MSPPSPCTLDTHLDPFPCNSQEATQKTYLEVQPTELAFKGEPRPK
jgi:hypothetical protein